MVDPFVTFKADKRLALWDRVQCKVGAPPPKGLAQEKAEWLKPGLVGRVKFLKGEEKLRHASLKDSATNIKCWLARRTRTSGPEALVSLSDQRPPGLTGGIAKGTRAKGTGCR
jgi:hypothetical protein